MTSRLSVDIESKVYRAATGGAVEALRGLAFTLEGGTVGALVGPSGSGKTTLLRIVTGLDRDYAGTVALPAHGRLGMVFQEPRLLPWRTVEDNVRLGAPEAAAADLDALFAALGLDRHRRHFPGELSLGQARRVALARALAVKPDLLVLDEPFVSLDAALAQRLQNQVAAAVTADGITTLLVTHSLEEAIALADRVFVLSGGPARVVAEVPVARPRAAHTDEEVVAVRGEIAAALAAASAG